MSKLGHSIKGRENANDVFMTPVALVTTHLEYIAPLVREGDKLLEPFCGSGNYLTAMEQKWRENRVDWCEISRGRDFFEYGGEVDAIISNPPYSIMDQVLEKSISLKPRVISYLIAIHALTPRRIEIMNKAGYGLESVKMVKVFKWYGISGIITFVKGGKNCIDFDRVVYK